PVASNVDFSGPLTLGYPLIGSYDYFDPDSDPEGASTYRWYRSDDGSGSGKIVIPGATDLTYFTTNDDDGKWLSFEVTPVDQFGAAGIPVESPLYGPFDPVTTNFNMTPPGWHWFSSNVDPIDPVMNNIWPQYPVDYVDSHGDGFYDGAVWNGGDGNWDIWRLYRIHSTSALTIAMTGRYMYPSVNPIDLVQNWNWIAYYPTADMTPAVALASIWDNLIIIHGQNGFCIPPGAIPELPEGFNNLTMGPGDGYMAYMGPGVNLTLTYPDPILPIAAIEQGPIAVTQSLVHFDPVETDHYYPVLFSDIESIDLPFSNGDEIALFANGPVGEFCIGASVWEGELPFAITAWADDPLTEIKDGFSAGEPIIMRLWSAEDDQEYELSVAYYNDVSSYESDLYSIVDLTTLSVEEPEPVDYGFGLAQNHPNPFNPHTTISFEIPAADRVTLRIFNGAGQIVRTLVDNEHQAGQHQVDWDGRNDNHMEVASGIYFYRLEAGDRSCMKKMVLLR
ncbi:MAG: T9SS type A sorting domain-containing protein, partial [Planctomycetes bacterium]|nr:T9SS type A sorting domain-containing protein [Planctomycetota bacterium]